MNYREDYYKFSHHLLPNMVFKYGSYILDWIKRDKDDFIHILKCTWNKIELDNENHRSSAPDFRVEIIDISKLHTMIIVNLSGISNINEQPYICITIDSDKLIRYFTYEIGNCTQGSEKHNLYEHTQEEQSVIYQPCSNLALKDMIKIISDELVYDIL